MLCGKSGSIIKLKFSANLTFISHFTDRYFEKSRLTITTCNEIAIHEDKANHFKFPREKEQGHSRIMKLRFANLA